jgi:hypothetical protein
VPSFLFLTLLSSKPKIPLNSATFSIPAANYTIFWAIQGNFAKFSEAKKLFNKCKQDQDADGEYF